MCEVDWVSLHRTPLKNKTNLYVEKVVGHFIQVYRHMETSIHYINSMTVSFKSSTRFDSSRSSCLSRARMIHRSNFEMVLAPVEFSFYHGHDRCLKFESPYFEHDIYSIQLIYKLPNNVFFFYNDRCLYTFAWWSWMDIGFRFPIEYSYIQKCSGSRSSRVYVVPRNVVVK